MVSTKTKKELEDLLRKLSKRRYDEKLWESLYRNLRSFVWALAYRNLSGNRAMAEDAVQEIFFRLFRYTDFSTFNTPEDFLAYLVTVTRHATVDLGRKALRYAIESPDEYHEDSAKSDPTPQQIDQARSLLGDVIGQMNGAQRQLAELLMEGKTLSEIARVLGLSYSAAGVRVHRLRQFLGNL
jgi:RNA polymerase sigma factor (sigma-70 family)